MFMNKYVVKGWLLRGTGTVHTHQLIDKPNQTKMIKLLKR